MRSASVIYAFCFLIILFTGAAGHCAVDQGMTLVREGKPVATIVVADNPTCAANLAALELQYHIEKITGAVLPIKTDCQEVSGNRILVGESAATRKIGLREQDFQPQEYFIHIMPTTIVLIGRDGRDSEVNRKETDSTSYLQTLDLWGAGRQEFDYMSATGRKLTGKEIITLPGVFDDQGTCYATYDFLERFCGVRWYGPTELGMVYPSKKTLVVNNAEIRRAPALKYRFTSFDRQNGFLYPTLADQWNNPAISEQLLYMRRLRLGGEKWPTSAHTFRSYQDRFLKEDSELFERKQPDFFAQDNEGKPRSDQMCYTNTNLVKQVAQDAGDFFDGKNVKGKADGFGDYFGISPEDNNKWCKCPRCQAMLARDKDNTRRKHFSTGLASHYWFSFVNAVAREVRKNHPDKYISTLAYESYAFKPEDIELEPNIAVAPCLQVKNYWAPKVKQNDLFFYKKWVEQEGRPIYLWNYYCFPEEIAFNSGWKWFPGFSAHLLAELIKMYHQDSVRGVFLCGKAEQVEFYLTMKMDDDPTTDIDKLLDEFFTSYFGRAAEPMKNFYTVIEKTFTNPDNYPQDLIAKEIQLHQTETIAWGYLGTKERMEKLGALIKQAAKLAQTDIEKKRVNTWEKGVWDHMLAGRKEFLAKVGGESWRPPAPVDPEHARLLEEQRKALEKNFASMRENLRNQQPPSIIVPKIALTMTSGDPAKVDWSQAIVAGDWYNVLGYPTERKVETRLVHDGKYLYVRLIELMDVAKLVIESSIYAGDNWDIFVAGQRAKPYRQIGVSPVGYWEALGHWEEGVRQRPWVCDAKVVSNVNSSQWVVLISLPLDKLLPAGSPGDRKFYMNFYRATPLDRNLANLAWSPNFKSSFHELDRLGEITLK